MSPGPLLTLRRGAIEVELAPEAGGRIAQLRVQGIEQLIGPADGWPATIAWGCYPMVPWAGRVRDGRFRFEGRDWQLPCNLGADAIHGVGFAMSWQVDSLDEASARLSLALPEDDGWAFGGIARQHITIVGGELRLTLSVQAGARAMPAEVGWHPWFRKPDQLEFAPSRMYPRDADGIAILPLVAPGPGPWDDCFLHEREIALHRAGRVLRLRSPCDHWVVYDGTAHATCVEPQSGPPDAFNLLQRVLQPGEVLEVSLAIAFD
ncbi:MAG TPA: aldose epimerase [Thermomonas sp.]|nr:aldose epimerase [Thermomonas sp.]